MKNCGECGKPIDAIAKNLYYSYCSMKCAIAADKKKEAKS